MKNAIVQKSYCVQPNSTANNKVIEKKPEKTTLELISSDNLLFQKTFVCEFLFCLKISSQTRSQFFFDSTCHPFQTMWPTRTYLQVIIGHNKIYN